MSTAEADVDFAPLKFVRRRHDGVDTRHVRVAGPYVESLRSTSLGPEARVDVLSGAYLIHADEGTVAACAVTGEWGSARILQHAAGGKLERLGTFRTWALAEDAAAAHAAGLDLRHPATRALLERRWRQRVNARRASRSRRTA